MARSFQIRDAKKVKSEFESIKIYLQGLLREKDRFMQAVRTSSEEYLTRELVRVLSDIPVDELNREKKGIRIKALRDGGYQTVADVAAATIPSLASVYGISEEGARHIKRVADEIVNTARDGLKIKISTDNKTPSATSLVKAIYQYRCYESRSQEIVDLLSQDRAGIESAHEDLIPATGSFRWLFSSRAKKEKAEKAYEYLSGYLQNGYRDKVDSVRQQIENAAGSSDEEIWNDFSKNSIGYFNTLEQVHPGVLGNVNDVYGLPEELAREIQDQAFFPEGLLCELRRYQEWGVKYALHQERVLLGDEMGLGKTVQAIATMVSLKNTGASHFMVVCPASVITNWCREIRKMSRLRVVKIHGAGRSQAIADWLKNGGVAVTTFETTGSVSLEDGMKFSMLVVDEAHYIKNPTARRSVNVRDISEHAERILFMTGTALENKVDEMVSLIQVLQPKVAGQIQGMEALSNAPQFREKVAPVYYRRKREDVLTELPELIENKEWCTLGTEEESVYEDAVLSKRYADARRVSWSVDDLQQSSKAKRLLELVEQAEAEDRKVIVFSFFLDTIRKIESFLGSRCSQPINGSVPPQRRQQIIDEFNDAPAGSVLIAQIQSGGTGLNIQSASVIILCEPQFKPSIENQAISRAYRMGQTRNVLVFRLLCEDTVDEKIMELLEEKQAIFDAFADVSVAASESKELDEKTFGNIIQEEIDRINAKKGKRSL